MRQPSSGRRPLIRRRLAVVLAVAGGIAACVLAVATFAGTTSVRPARASGASVPRHTALERAVTRAPGEAIRADGLVTLDGSPGSPAANPETGTLYVPIQCVHTDCVPGAPERVVDVVNAAKCNATARAGCRVTATIRVGTGPLGAVVDERTDTIYVTNGNSNTVSVINGADCNAGDTRGCATAVVATVKVGKFPVADAFNPATRTVYVANLTGSISVLNAATCNARSTQGCGKRVRTVLDKAGPGWLDIDGATDTVYAANSGRSGEGGDTVSVIDGAACNGRTGRGCGHIRASVNVGVNPFELAVDQATNSVYVANHDGVIGGPASVLGPGSVSVINGAQCNAKITSGCRGAPATVPAGANTSAVVVDDALHTAFAVNEFDDTMSAIDTRTCNGAVISGCANRPPNQQAEPDQGPGYAQFPTVFTIIGKFRTAYVTDEGGPNRLSVLDIGRCNAIMGSGCRHEAPNVPDHDTSVTEDPATRTIYASNASRPRIDVISAAACYPGHPSGCAPVAAIPMSRPQAKLGGIDHVTHTLYAADPATGKVAVINTAACNASHTSGCSAAPPLITVGPNPGPPGVNPRTSTMYVPEGKASSKVAVINAATCNATNSSGCGQKPAWVSVAKGTFNLAVSPATNTVYASATGLPEPTILFSGSTIAVINGATCNGTNHSGCGHLAATIRAGRAPFGMTVDDPTHTLYAAINTSGGFPASVAVINIATCNGTHTTGCHRPFPHMPTGATTLQTALDTSAGTLYVTDGTSAEVTELNTAHCNATSTTSCRTPGRRVPVGSSPNAVAVDQHSGTVYVTNAYQAGTLTVFAAQH